MKALIVEDHEETRELIRFCMENENYEVIDTDSGLEALKILKKMDLDVIILDLMLPDMDGMTLSEMVRNNQDKYGNPILIMLTAKNDQETVLKGLRSGADDYLTKPFNIEELLLRIKAVEKRTKSKDSKIYTYKSLEIDTKNRIIYENGDERILSRKEYDLLLYMVKNNELLLTRSKLMSTIWNKEYMEGDRSVDACVKRLRQKLRTVSDEIITVTGFGYRLG